jgi:murein DD-endopeptidase MepM/ murein hydrolase activator NlpD
MMVRLATLGLCAMTMVGHAQAAPEPPTAGKNSSSLPSGNSAEFRDRMLDWTAPPPPVSRTREVLRDMPGGRLFISSPFGWRSDPIKGIHRRHAGIDLPGPPMTSVHATGAGIVRIAGRAGGYGNLVEIEHPGGVRTRYGHLARVLVSPGETVEQGEAIGRMGSTGRSTGTHLHYEVRVNGLAVNPLEYIGQTVPSYQTAWAPERPVAARWAGWSGTPAGHSLPGAKIR